MAHGILDDKQMDIQHKLLNPHLPHILHISPHVLWTLLSLFLSLRLLHFHSREVFESQGYITMMLTGTLSVAGISQKVQLQIRGAIGDHSKIFFFFFISQRKRML